MPASRSVSGSRSYAARLGLVVDLECRLLLAQLPRLFAAVILLSCPAVACRLCSWNGYICRVPLWTPCGCARSRRGPPLSSRVRVVKLVSFSVSRLIAAHPRVPPRQPESLLRVSVLQARSATCFTWSRRARSTSLWRRTAKENPRKSPPAARASSSVACVFDCAIRSCVACCALSLPRALVWLWIVPDLLRAGCAFHPLPSICSLCVS